MIGRTIGNYVVRAKVGEGGMGVVYRAEHPQLNRSVAIKVLHPGVDRSPEVVHRFFNEAKAATEIRNEHIVEVLDFGELPDGAPYLVMEWLEGHSLGDVLRIEPRLSVARTAAVVQGISQALRAAHAKGVIHRDLKPDNVFLVKRNGEADFIKVLDFGIAKLMRATDSNRYQTQTGAIIGTPAYMSPEQCRGVKSIDTRTDLYSLGVMAYQMLTGRLPFAADALGELLFKHLSEKPPTPASLQLDVPVAVSAIVFQTLEKEPDKRPTLDQIAAVMATVTKDSRVALGTSPDASGGGDAQASTSTSVPPILGALPSVVPSRPPSSLASATTLSATATEMRIRHRPPNRRSGRVIAVAIVGAAIAAAAASVIARKASAPARNAALERAAAPKSPAPASVPVLEARVEIRTEPEFAGLEVDGQRVPNPFIRKTVIDGRVHDVVATLPGFASVRHAIAFDRGRDIVLKLTPLAAVARSIAPAPSPANPADPADLAKPAKPGHDDVSGQTAPAPAAGVVSRDPRAHGPSSRTTGASSGQAAPGYHGSKLKIETDFP